MSETQKEETENLQDSQIFKHTEVFESKVFYLDNENREQAATIYVEINYKTLTFDIIDNSRNANFKFKQNSHQYKMWLATIEAIKNGIEKAVFLIEECKKAQDPQH